MDSSVFKLMLPSRVAVSEKILFKSIKNNEQLNILIDGFSLNSTDVRLVVAGFAVTTNYYVQSTSSAEELYELAAPEQAIAQDIPEFLAWFRGVNLVKQLVHGDMLLLSSTCYAVALCVGYNTINNITDSTLLNNLAQLLDIVRPGNAGRY